MNAGIWHAGLVAAHVTAVAVLLGGLLAQQWMLNALEELAEPLQIATLDIASRFDRAVTTPALLLTWSFGLALAILGGWLASRWLIIKLVFVVAVSALHGVQSGRMRRFLRNGEYPRGIPGARVCIVLAALTIATLAVAKPF